MFFSIFILGTITTKNVRYFEGTYNFGNVGKMEFLDALVIITKVKNKMKMIYVGNVGVSMHCFDSLKNDEKPIINHLVEHRFEDHS